MDNFVVGRVLDHTNVDGSVVVTLRPCIATEGRSQPVTLTTALPDHVAALHAGTVVTIKIGSADDPFCPDPTIDR